MRPDLISFNKHIADPSFQLGVEQSKWGILNNSDERPEWPFVLIWIAAAERNKAADRYYFKFDLGNYPAVAPNIGLWKPETNTSLPALERPKGSGNVSMIFRSNWLDGSHLYAPYERTALQTHPDWPSAYPDLMWKPTDKIHKIVNDLHINLNSTEYHGQ